MQSSAPAAVCGDPQHISQRSLDEYDSYDTSGTASRRGVWAAPRPRLAGQSTFVPPTGVRFARTRALCLQPCESPAHCDNLGYVASPGIVTDMSR